MAPKINDLFGMLFTNSSTTLTTDDIRVKQEIESLTNYGSTTEEQHALEHGSTTEEQHALEYSREQSDLGIGKNKFRKSLKVLSAVVLCLAFIAGGRFFVMKKKDTRNYEKEEKDVSAPSTLLPFSYLDPINDLNLQSYRRSINWTVPQCLLPPNNREKNDGDRLEFQASPTNMFYNNVLFYRQDKNGMKPTKYQRTYVLPYVVDFIGPIPGVQIVVTNIDVSEDIVQLSTYDQDGITLGQFHQLSKDYNGGISDESFSYRVAKTTPLGLTLEWENNMTSSIVRGMPYVTVHYPIPLNTVMLPTIASHVDMHFLDKPIVDGSLKVNCNGNALFKAEREIQFYILTTDFTWLVFFSEPVYFSCSSKALTGSNGTDSNSPPFSIQVIGTVDGYNRRDGNFKNDGEHQEDQVLTIRASLSSNCTKNQNPMFCKNNPPSESLQEEYANLLRKYSNIYPGPNTDVEFSINHETNEANVTFDWDARDMTTRRKGSSESNSVNSASSLSDESKNRDRKAIEKSKNLLLLGLPHQYNNFHRESSTAEVVSRKFCRYAMRGVSCYVEGSTWTLQENLPQVSFRAPRPPRLDMLELTAKAVKDDLQYTMPEWYTRGASFDTYFVGKMLAKLARIMLIAEEILGICSDGHFDENSDGSNSSAPYKEVCTSLKDEGLLPTDPEMHDALERLRNGVEVWHEGFTKVGESPFVYDSDWGGIVNCGCIFNWTSLSCDNVYPNDCPALYDQGINFGNGFYNDHHFHYGYHIYASATVAHFDNDWGEKNYERILLLVRDIANPSKEDKFFPVFRVKDWFMGNSWASGIVSESFINGKNEESASESIAAWEAVAIFGDVMGEIFKKRGLQKQMTSANQVRDVGRLLTATEITATDWYWHVRLDDLSRGRIYPEPYDHRVIGNVWSTMVQFQTWFGNKDFLVYGIQLVPTTPIAEFRDDTSWAREAYAPLAESCSSDSMCESQGWSIVVYEMLAQLGHVNEAVERVLAIPREVFQSEGGSGHSLSNVLYFISTRPKIEPLYLGEYERTRSPTAEPTTRPFDFHESKNCPKCSSSICKSTGILCDMYELPFVCLDGVAKGGCMSTPWPIDPSSCTKCCLVTPANCGTG